MRTVKLSRSQIGRLAAGKAWSNMTSEGGVHFVRGIRALYSNLFMFDDRHIRHVVYRLGITPGKALAVIGKGRLHKRRVSNAVRLFKETMGLREGAMLQR